MSEPERDDLSLCETVGFACRCGAVVSAIRWRWIDVVRRPVQAERVRREGPYEGTCIHCSAPLVALGAWLALEPRKERALLVLWEHQRGELLDVMEDHLRTLRRHPDRIHVWMVHPAPKFLPLPSERVGSREMGAHDESLQAERSAQVGAMPLAPLAAVTGSGVPQPLGSDPRAGELSTAVGNFAIAVGDLEQVEGAVEVRARVPEGQSSHWAQAAITARPIHLRHLGYPLVGVRVVGSYVGRVACIEGIGDVGDPTTNALLRVLAKKFQIRLRVEEEGSARVVERRVLAADLERNAALCLESARGMLGSGEFPPQAYEVARKALVGDGLARRLRPGEPSLHGGAYAHLVGARETLKALSHLVQVSTPEALARILEVEGLPVREYEAIRRRVLRAALDQGLCVPRRFWRRVVASGLAGDLQDYVTKLADNRARAVEQGDDLDEEQRQQAWESIAELCRRKSIDFPPPLLAAVPVDVTSELDPGTGSEGLVGQLHDRERRLSAATQLLGTRVSDHSLERVLDLLEEFDTEELLAILPNLSELGARAVPGLVHKLGSERREVRQAAAILLGLTSAHEALAPLVRFVVEEPTSVWIDASRALATYGSAALEPLCAVLVQAHDSLGSPPDESVLLGRVSRAMAEIAVENAHGDGRWAVERLDTEGTGSHALVAEAARRALATLTDVSESAAQIRGERPLAEVTAVRGFSRRAYEAIMVPELELVDDVELEG